MSEERGTVFNGSGFYVYWIDCHCGEPIDLPQHEAGTPTFADYNYSRTFKCINGHEWLVTRSGSSLVSFALPH